MTGKEVQEGSPYPFNYTAPDSHRCECAHCCCWGWFWVLMWALDCLDPSLKSVLRFVSSKAEKRLLRLRSQLKPHPRQPSHEAKTIEVAKVTSLLSFPTRPELVLRGYPPQLLQGKDSGKFAPGTLQDLRSALKFSPISSITQIPLLTSPLRGWLRHNILNGSRNRLVHGTRRTRRARKLDIGEEQSWLPDTLESPGLQIRPSI